MWRGCGRDRLLSRSSENTSTCVSHIWEIFNFCLVLGEGGVRSPKMWSWWREDRCKSQGVKGEGILLFVCYHII